MVSSCNTTSAYVVNSSTSAFTKQEVNIKALGPSDVTVDFICSGLCHTDVHMQKNDWGITKYPTVPGHEGVGIVTSVGASVENLKVGDKVGVGWISGSCGNCSRCFQGEENICDGGYEGTYLGENAMYGTFQKVQTFNKKFCYKIPEGIPDAVCAPLLCAGITVYAPIKRYVKPNMNVGVISMGGLGHMAVQFASALGAEVTVYSTSKNKEKNAIEFGATRLVVFKDENEMKNRLSSEDFILNTCPYEVDFELFSGCIKKGGVLAFVGIPESGSNSININLYEFIFGQKTFAGSIVGGGVDMREMFGLVKKKGLKSSVEVRHFDEINEVATQLMKGEMKSYRFVFAWDNVKLLQDEANKFLSA